MIQSEKLMLITVWNPQEVPSHQSFPKGAQVQRGMLCHGIIAIVVEMMLDSGRWK
jgi:hypothetical protein